jgi:hypothetical protein
VGKRFETTYVAWWTNVLVRREKGGSLMREWVDMGGETESGSGCYSAFRHHS